jgi:hypothetical protein
MSAVFSPPGRRTGAAMEADFSFAAWRDQDKFVRTGSEFQ